MLDEATGELTELYEAGVHAATTTTGRGSRPPSARRSAVTARGRSWSSPGSLPPGTPVDGYARLARLATAAGARAVVDSDGAVAAPPRSTSDRGW